jgi:Predicted permeases
MSTGGLHVAETVLAFTLLVLAGYFLKRKGVLKQEDSPIFARLLTQAILPATIFYQLWTYHLSGENFAPSADHAFVGNCCPCDQLAGRGSV